MRPNSATVTAIAITIPSHLKKKDSRPNLRCAPEYFGVNSLRMYRSLLTSVRLRYDLGNALDNLSGQERLWYASITVQFFRNGLTESRDKNNRQLRTLRNHLPCQFEAANFGHDHIGQEKRNLTLVFVKESKSFGAIACFQYTVAVRLQGHTK